MPRRRRWGSFERGFPMRSDPGTRRAFTVRYLVGRPIAPGEAFAAADLALLVFEQSHGRVTTLGFRTGGFGYSTDVVALDDAAFAALDGVDTWVVDCFQRQVHTTHAHLDVVFSWVERLRPRRTVLTHMGTDMDWRWLCANLPPGIEAGFDGMILEIPG